MITTMKTMTIMATAPYFFGHNDNEENDHSDNNSEIQRQQHDSRQTLNYVCRPIRPLVHNQLDRSQVLAVKGMF